MAKASPRDSKPAPPSFQPSAEYLFTVVSAWLIPGAGHFLMGHRVRGTVLGIVVLGLFWSGQWLSVRAADGPSEKTKPIAVSHKVSPVFFGCQVGNGFSTLLSDLLWGQPLRGAGEIGAIDRALPQHYNLAILLTSISGLLNVLLVLHVMDPKSWRPGEDETPGPAPPAGKAAT